MARSSAARPPPPRIRGAPLYDKIARELRARIDAGEYPVGSHIPTEEQLCRRYGVSRQTVRAALRKLRNDELIVSVRQDITGCVVSAAVAADLQIEAGSPAIQVQRAYQASDGKIAQVTVDTHPASRFHYAMTMSRLRP